MSTDGVLAELPLLDHHCHGVTRSSLDLAEFELHLTEGFEPPVSGSSHFDSPVGMALRRWCAPALGVSVEVQPEAYVERRSELGERAVAETLLRAGGFDGLVIDTGYSSPTMFDLGEMADIAGRPTYEVVRLETVMEEVAASGIGPEEFGPAFRERLDELAADAVGLKTVAAYRCGFGFDPTRPSPSEVAEAYDRWQRGGHPERVDDPALIRAGIWTGADACAARGLPLQVHVGFGDPEARLHLADPSLLSELLERLAQHEVVVTLLHCYPFHRQAGHLAWIYPNVYFDVGLAIPFSGPSAGRILAESMELAPFAKQLFSSDARDIPELYLIAAAAFREALGGLLEDWVVRGFLSASQAEDAALAIASENARRIYPLPD